MFRSHTEDTSLKGLKEMVSHWSYITCCCNIKFKGTFFSFLFFNCTATNDIAEVGLEILRPCKTSTRLGGLNSRSTTTASATQTYFLKSFSLTVKIGNINSHLQHLQNNFGKNNQFYIPSSQYKNCC